MSDHVRALGVKLRSIRQQQGLSLPGVEHKSGGQWKATVVGSYGVPVNELPVTV